VSEAATRPGLAPACLLCCRPVGLVERRCPAFALAGIAAHAGCCGGCTATAPARPAPTAARPRVDELARLGPGDLLAALGELDRARAAETYAALGFPVVAMHTTRPVGGCTCPAGPGCTDPGKHPRLAAWPRLASIEPATVRGWWRRWPDANLALATGRRFDVLDLDGTQGVEALRALIGRNPLDHPGPVARSGGGGWHLLYAPIGLGNRVRLLPGVDWRGRGGLIVAPPSRHASGGPTAGSGP
jgi:Bifunctional DNA primase/polymerase, N-terminal